MNGTLDEVLALFLYVYFTEMPRFYTNKTDRVRRTTSEINNAVTAVTSGSESIRTAAKAFSISRSVLQRNCLTNIQARKLAYQYAHRLGIVILLNGIRIKWQVGSGW